jgi:hypothetical protein
MSADAITPWPEAEYSYTCDCATRLPKVVEISENSGQGTTYQYSVERRPRSRKPTTTTTESAAS